MFDRRRLRSVYTPVAIALGVIGFGAQARADDSLFAQRQPNQAAAAANPVRQASNSEPSRMPSPARDASLPLPSAPQRDGQKVSSGTHTFEAVLSVVGSLAAVLGLFFLVAWIARRGLPSSATSRLPTEVVEVLGRAPLAGRQQMQLLRLGNKLILVCISASGVSTLGEVNDPVEVQRLAGMCRPGKAAGSNGVAKNLRQSLRAITGEAGDA